jgi:hypothetical protein
MKRRLDEYRPLIVVTLRPEPHIDPTLPLRCVSTSCGASRWRPNRRQSASIVNGAAADPRHLPRLLARVLLRAPRPCVGVDDVAALETALDEASEAYRAFRRVQIDAAMKNPGEHEPSYFALICQRRQLRSVKYCGAVSKSL